MFIILSGKWWGAGVVFCLERSADLHVAQLMSLPLTVSCISKIQIGFTFLVPAHLGSPGQRAVKHVCVCVCVRVHARVCVLLFSVCDYVMCAGQTCIEAVNAVIL